MADVYIERDKETGQIRGVYANPQPQPDGTCLTEPDPLQEDSAEVQAFLTRSRSPAQ